MFQNDVNEGQLPKERREAYTYYIHIQNRKLRCADERAIEASVYSKSNWKKKKKIGDEPAGFTAGKSCTDYIFTIQQLWENKMDKNRDVHMAFIDCKLCKK